MKSSDTLTKAKSVIFENTKMIKNQELQIEALNQQVESLRDVVKITKELLEIRNLEVDQLESKIHCMEERHKAEKERQDLMHKRLEQMIRHNGDLKREYETQLCLFKALRDRYDERELAKGVVDSLKSDIKVEKDKNIQQKQPSTPANQEANNIETEKKEGPKENQQDSTNKNETLSDNQVQDKEQVIDDKIVVDKASESKDDAVDEKSANSLDNHSGDSHEKQDIQIKMEMKDNHPEPNTLKQ
ncbi:rootletin-like [Coccinella septempunctata]|uniref:rootletin-like n=1 Tax=Coccinella septempunctata TaxID=41139 RepID=UPI001D06164B|nr:rootletin-like [Coccinella septempunctata]